MCKIGNATSVVVELWALRYGSSLALSLGFPLVVVEVDALLVVSYLISFGQVHPRLICLVDIIASHCWGESIQGEANKCMDALAYLRRLQKVDFVVVRDIFYIN